MNILGIIEIDGQNKYLNIEKDRNLYKYYLDEQFIGVYDPTKMIEDKIIFRENTIENELSADAKDKIKVLKITVQHLFELQYSYRQAYPDTEAYLLLSVIP